MQRGVAIHALGGTLCPKEAVLQNDIFVQNFIHFMSLLCEVPGGNQVDGLPPVASTRAGYRDARFGRNICVHNGRLCADFSPSLCLFLTALQTGLGNHYILPHAKFHDDPPGEKFCALQVFRNSGF